MSQEHRPELTLVRCARKGCKNTWRVLKTDQIHLCSIACRTSYFGASSRHLKDRNLKQRESAEKRAEARKKS